MSGPERDTESRAEGPREGAVAPLAPAAEAKRQAARRRFLRGAATGIVIVTFAHQRAGANARLLASSPASCMSLTGHEPSGRTVEVDSPNGNGLDRDERVRRYVCD